MSETKQIIRYEVYDRRDRWMGGYSTKLDNLYSTSSYYMAKINSDQCGGKVYEIYEDGIKEEIKTKKKNGLSH
jgi:hypothetical protein